VNTAILTNKGFRTNSHSKRTTPSPDAVEQKPDAVEQKLQGPSLKSKKKLEECTEIGPGASIRDTRCMPVGSG